MEGVWSTPKHIILTNKLIYMHLHVTMILDQILVFHCTKAWLTPWTVLTATVTVLKYMYWNTRLHYTLNTFILVMLMKLTEFHGFEKISFSLKIKKPILMDFDSYFWKIWLISSKTTPIHHIDCPKCVHNKHFQNLYISVSNVVILEWWECSSKSPVPTK